MSKIEKTIARQKQKIEEGQFYEAHQQLRVIAARYIKQEAYDAAIDILASGAQLLLTAGQGASGGDLCLLLIEVLNKAERKPDAAAKARLLVLLRAYPVGEPTRKRFIGEMIGWSSRFGEYPAGDPELHHVAGTIYADDGEVYDAEKHLVLGTKDSPPCLAALEYTWYTTDAAHTAGQYAARAVFPYLLVGNLRAANQFFLIFTSKLSQQPQPPAVTEASSAKLGVKIYPSLPLLNFLALLLLAVQRGNADLFRSLQVHYAVYLKDVGVWDEALESVAEMYFAIRRPVKGNPMLDMLGSMFMGGGGGGGAGTGPGRASPKPKHVAAPAPAPALD